MTTRLSLGCNTHFSHSIRGTIRLFTAMAIPFSGSARKVESSATVHPSFTSVSLLFTVSFILYQFMNLLVNTKSCFLTGWYEVRSNNPFGGTNRIRFTGYNLSPSAVYVGHPFVLRWQRYGKEMNNATTDCFIFVEECFL